SDECSSLLNKYIPSTYSTPNPLRISGFDNQIYNLFGGDSAEELVKTTLKEGSFKSDVSQIPDKQFYNAMDTLLSSVYKSRDQLINPSDEVVVLLKDFGTSLGKLLSLSTDRESFGIQVLHNIKTFNDEILHFSDRKFDSQRDSMMAENIIWLLNNKFKNEKVIIWAANSHIGKDGNSNFTPMTDFLLKKVDEQHVYSLAFTS